MPEMRVSIVFDPSANKFTVEFGFSRVVDDEAEAEEAGEADKRLVDAYLVGYGRE